jgi:DNA-binding LacI/PurR family transcriptional regulator
MARPTMADVANRAGVSTSTVSLVLNDKPGISPEVRASVMQAVDDLGYRVRERKSTPVASPIERNKTISVVHFASPEEGYGFEASRLFLDFVASIQDYFQSENVNWALIPNYREGDNNNLGFQLMQNDNILSDGLILIGILNQNNLLLQNALANDIPVVVASRNWPNLPVSTVSQDHWQATEIALEHLILLGHKKIAFLGRDVDRNYDWFQTRLDCYCKVMENLGEPVLEDLIITGVSGAEAVKTLIQHRPDVTAIFAIHDENAVSAMQGLTDLGLKIPQDVSIIGLDDSATPAAKQPGLTTVSFQHSKVGQLAAKLLLEQIDSDNNFYSKVFLRCHLIERESCAPPRG